MTAVIGESIKIDSILSKEILTKMFAGICIIGTEDLLIKYVSPRFEEMFGSASAEFINKDASVVGLKMDKETRIISKEVSDTIKKTGFWRGEKKNIKKDGSELYCDTKFWFFEHPKYGTMLFGIYLDITGRKKVENKIKEKIEELEKINKLMIGRELKMVELKEKIKKLEKKQVDKNQFKKK